MSWVKKDMARAFTAGFLFCYGVSIVGWAQAFSTIGYVSPVPSAVIWPVYLVKLAAGPQHKP